MILPHRVTRIAGVAATLLIVGCSDDVSKSTTKTADSSASPADVVTQDSSAKVIEPTVEGPGHAAGGYAEVSGQWDAATQRLKVVVWVGSVEDLLGIAAHLHYDPKALQLTKLELQSIAEQGDDAPGVWQSRGIAKEAPLGRILLGSARFRTTTAPFLFPSGAAVEREKWVILEFAVLATGESALWFDPPSQLARAGDGAALKLQWLGGKIKVPQAVVVGKAGGVP